MFNKWYHSYSDMPVKITSAVSLKTVGKMLEINNKKNNSRNVKIREIKIVED